MIETGSDIEDGSESPIVGICSDEHEKAQRSPASDPADTKPNLKMEMGTESELDASKNADPLNEKISNEMMLPPRLLGFSTASGKIIPVSEKALEAAKKKLELDAFENAGSSKEETSAGEQIPAVPGFVGFSTASGKCVPVSKKAIENAKMKMDFDALNNAGKQNAVAGTGPVTSTTYCFDAGNQSRLSPEESNEVEDCTRLLLEDILDNDESAWDEEGELQGALSVKTVREPEKKTTPVFTPMFTKRSYLEESGKRPELSKLCTPAKRGRLTKFVPPRRKDL